MEKNTLGHPQAATSGTSGAVTFGKYEFQYHWALCRIIEKHRTKCDYALLIEYHEDVVIANSLDAKSAKFEFFQVKNTIDPFTPHSLTKREVGSDGIKKNSILGKMLKACDRKDYEVTEIGLVSSSGFSLDKTDNKLKLDIINTGNLSKACLSKLRDEIESELGIKVLPKYLNFIVPKIKLENQSEYVIARFAELIDETFPNSQCNAVNIYRAIIDEIHRKGQNKYDYTLWRRMIEDKALTSQKVNDVIAVNTTSLKLQEFERSLQYLAKTDLNWNMLKYRRISGKVKQLFLRRTGFSSAFDINIMRIAHEALNSIPEENFSETKDYLEAVILKAKELNIEDQIQDHDDVLSEIIYCFLKVMHE